jgi:hypothetical protein
VGVVHDKQMTTTLIYLHLKLIHHFSEGTDIDTTDINSGTSGDSHISIRLRETLALSTRPFLHCLHYAYAIDLGHRTRILYK